MAVPSPCPSPMRIATSGAASACARLVLGTVDARARRDELHAVDPELDAIGRDLDAVLAPSAISIRPQFGSAPCSAQRTSWFSAIARTATSAWAPSSAPKTS